MARTMHVGIVSLEAETQALLRTCPDGELGTVHASSEGLLAARNGQYLHDHRKRSPFVDQHRDLGFISLPGTSDRNRNCPSHVLN